MPSRRTAATSLVDRPAVSGEKPPASASPVADVGRSFVDLENGIFYRLARGKRETNKRQTPVPIPQRLLAHLRRWQAKGISQERFVEWNGKPVKNETAASTHGKLLKSLVGPAAATFLDFLQVFQRMARC